MKKTNMLMGGGLTLILSILYVHDSEVDETLVDRIPMFYCCTGWQTGGVRWNPAGCYSWPT